jgi:hypothetical protein
MKHHSHQVIKSRLNSLFRKFKVCVFHKLSTQLHDVRAAGVGGVGILVGKGQIDKAKLSTHHGGVCGRQISNLAAKVLFP